MSELAKKYTNGRIVVKAVQITEANIREVAEWCGGTAYIIPEIEEMYVRIPKSSGLDRAFVGEWLVSNEQTEAYLVWRDEPFTKQYTLFDDWLVKAAD